MIDSFLLLESPFVGLKIRTGPYLKHFDALGLRFTDDSLHPVHSMVHYKYF